VSMSTGTAPSALIAPQDQPAAATGIRPVRRRNPLLAAVMALVLIGAVGLTVFSEQQANHEVQVVQVTAAVAVGEPVDAITPVEVAANSGIGYVLWSQRGQLPQYVAAVALVPGQPLLSADVTAGSAMPSGDELVGLTVAAGDYPAGLAQGEKVTVRVGGSSGASTNSLSAGPALFTDAPVAEVVYSQGADPTAATALINLYLKPSQANALAEGRGAGTVMVSVDGSSG